MKTKTNFIITTICLIIYILNQIYLKQLGILFFNNYLNDLLSVPLFFSIINIIAHYNNNKQLTSFKHLFLITIILSFMGEYLAKYFRPKSITDPIDIICYFIGLIIYYTIIKISSKNN